MDRHSGAPNFWKGYATKSFFSTMNCPAATLLTIQEMTGDTHDAVLTASGGLAGGMGGSTCGVLFGGALGLGIQYSMHSEGAGSHAEAAVVEKVGEFLQWFEESYGTTDCRERTGIEFTSLGKMAQYMVPGHKAVKCLAHLRKAVGYLQEQILDPAQVELNSGDARCSHCAGDVLSEIREQTGVGSDVLESSSVVLDGGVGLHGGACGALAAAALVTGLMSGTDFHRTTMKDGMGAMAAMVRAGGTSKPVRPGKHHYDVFKSSQAFERIKSAFLQQAESVRCSEIVGRRFNDYADFQDWVTTSERCRSLKAIVAESTVGELAAAGMQDAIEEPG